MKQIGAIVLSHGETGDLSRIIPWKSLEIEQLVWQANCQGIELEGLIHLSTCNRVEFIYSLKDSSQHSAFYHLLQDFAPTREFPAQYSDTEAIRHLIRLASGLESMVLGETEIRAQLKQGVSDAEKNDRMGKTLRILFQHIFRESRDIRSVIPMNMPLSVASLAVRHLGIALQDRLHPKENLQAKSSRAETGRYIPEEKGLHIVIIGSGPMSRHSAEYIAKWNEVKLSFVNRSIEKVEDLGKRFDAPLYSFEHFINFPESVGPADAILTATSRPDPFLTADIIGKMQKHDNPVIVDIALPPDADPNLANHPDFTLISMSSLHETLKENEARREEAAEQASLLVDDATYRIQAEMISALSGRLIKEYQKNIRDKSRQQLNDLLEQRLQHLSARDRRLLYSWAIQANRDMNRIHKKGLEAVLKSYLTRPAPGLKVENSHRY